MMGSRDEDMLQEPTTVPTFLEDMTDEQTMVAVSFIYCWNLYFFKLNLFLIYARLNSELYYVMAMDICFSKDCADNFFGYVLDLFNPKNAK